MKLTYVQFHQRMYGNNHTNTVKFYTNVRVLHMPGDNPRIEIDLDEIFAKRRLPKGAMYMRCDQLHVYQRPREKGRPTQEMEARGRVSVEAEEFSGKADRVIYDEEKDQVIFDGGDSLATLYKVDRVSKRPEHIQGRKIIYSRRTGEHSGIDIRSIDK
jgi:LptA/(LptD N-terminal domain) LPS transport protein